MPELPEVEVVRRGLDAHVVGRRIEAVTVHDPRSLRRHEAGPVDFAAALVGRTVLAARRRGKYLWLALDNDDAILAHLGMSGQMLVQPAGTPLTRHERLVFALDDGSELWFVDQRLFGGMIVSEGGALLPPEVAHIALDPLDPEFDLRAFSHRLRTRSSGIKRSLLDQTLISGIGNIYADESLWRAQLHYDRRAATLRSTDVHALVVHVRDVMKAALEQGGTSFDSLYVNVNGQSGYFDRSLDVYGREGEPCHRCGTPVERTPFMNRSSYWCPVCQPRPRARRPHVASPRSGAAER